MTSGAVVSLDGSGAPAELTVAVGAASATPFLLSTVDLVGAQASDALLEEITGRAREALTDPWSDEIAPAEYRANPASHLARPGRATTCPPMYYLLR